MLKKPHLSRSDINENVKLWKPEQSGKSCVSFKHHRLDIVFAIRVFAMCVGRDPLPSFSPCELECLPVSLSNATGVFEYSGQEVKNTLPHLFYFFF